MQVPFAKQSTDILCKRFKGDGFVKSIAVLQFGADFCRDDISDYGQITYLVGKSFYFIN